HGCDPKQTYPVSFLDPVNKTGATVGLSSQQLRDGPVTVRLAPCGRATVRFVDREGKPRPRLAPIFYVVARPGEKGVYPDSDFAANVDPAHYFDSKPADAQGRLTYPVLIPGATYSILGYRSLFPVKTFTARAGETLDLGDVVVQGP